MNNLINKEIKKLFNICKNIKIFINDERYFLKEIKNLEELEEIIKEQKVVDIKLFKECGLIVHN